MSWAVCKSQWSSCLHLLSTGIIEIPLQTQILHAFWGSELRSLCLHAKRSLCLAISLAPDRGTCPLVTESQGELQPSVPWSELRHDFPQLLRGWEPHRPESSRQHSFKHEILSLHDTEKSQGERRPLSQPVLESLGKKTMVCFV